MCLYSGEDDMNALEKELLGNMSFDDGYRVHDVRCESLSTSEENVRQMTVLSITDDKDDVDNDDRMDSD